MTVVALSGQHVSRFGAPILRKVDTRIFELRYFTHCLACGFCADQCCSYGVDIDLNNAQRLRALGCDFSDFVGVPVSDWFTEVPVTDAEFPSGKHLRTRIRGSHCVFHDPVGRGCKIHAWCEAQNLDYHLYKPMVSVLFPLTFNDGCLEPSNEVLDGSLVCSGSGPSLYEGVRMEIRYYFGPNLTDELDRLM